MVTSDQVFYPYRLYPYFAFPIGLCGIGAYILCGYMWAKADFIGTLFFLVFAVLSSLLCKHLYDTSGLYARFSDNGIMVFQNKHEPEWFVSWADICGVCYARDRRNHSYLLFSTEPLDGKQANALAQKSALTTKLLLNGSVILYLQQGKSTDFFLPFLPAHISVTDFR